MGNPYPPEKELQVKAATLLRQQAEQHPEGMFLSRQTVRNIADVLEQTRAIDSTVVLARDVVETFQDKADDELREPDPWPTITTEDGKVWHFYADGFWRYRDGGDAMTTTLLLSKPGAELSGPLPTNLPAWLEQRKRWNERMLGNLTKDGS